MVLCCKNKSWNGTLRNPRVVYKISANCHTVAYKTITNSGHQPSTTWNAVKYIFSHSIWKPRLVDKLSKNRLLILATNVSMINRCKQPVRDNIFRTIIRYKHLCTDIYHWGNAEFEIDYTTVDTYFYVPLIFLERAGVKKIILSPHC
jgi:hypothetical protein